jgi:hypothetical protein
MLRRGPVWLATFVTAHLRGTTVCPGVPGSLVGELILDPDQEPDVHSITRVGCNDG